MNRPTVSTVSQETLVTTAPRMPATSETRNQWWPSSEFSQSDRPGTVNVGMSGIGGDCLSLPPAAMAALPSWPEPQGGQVLGGAERQDVDRDTGDDVVDAEGDGGDGVDQAAERAAEDAGQRRGPGAVLPADPAGRERAEHHHAFEADVDHAGPLGPQSAQTRQADRYGGAQRGAELAGGGEVPGAGDGPQRGDRDQADGDDQQDPGVGQLAPAALPGDRGLRRGLEVRTHADTSGLSLLSVPSLSDAGQAASSSPTLRCWRLSP